MKMLISLFFPFFGAEVELDEAAVDMGEGEDDAGRLWYLRTQAFWLASSCERQDLRLRPAPYGST